MHSTLARVLSIALAWALLVSSPLSPYAGGNAPLVAGAGPEGAITLRVQTPAYTLDASGLRVPGYGHHVTPGAPSLPVWATTVELPPTGGWTISYDAGQAITLPVPAPLPSVPVPDYPSLRGPSFGVARREAKQSLTSQEIASSPPSTPSAPQRRTPLRTLLATTTSDEPDFLPTLDRPDPAIYAVDAFYPASPVQAAELGWQAGRRMLAVRVFPFQYNPVAAVVRYHPDVRVTVMPVATADEKPATGIEPSGGLVRDREQPAKASNPEREAIDRAGSQPLPEAAVLHPLQSPAQPPTSALRIRTLDRGLYRLTWADLATAGAPVTTTNPITFAMSYLGQPIDIQVTGEEDGSFDPGDLVIFYAEPYVGRYQRDNVYWLTWGGETGSRMATRTAMPTGAEPLVTTITQTLHLEYDRDYRPLYDRPRDADHWFDKQLYPTTATPTVTVPYTLTLDDPLRTGELALTAVFFGGQSQGANPDQSVALRLNGHAIGVYQWDGSTAYTATAMMPAAWLDGSPDRLYLEAALSQLPGLSFYWVSPDWVELRYAAQADAENDRIYIEAVGPGPKEVAVSGFTTDTVKVYDVTDPRHPVQLTAMETNVITRSTLSGANVIARSTLSGANVIARSTLSGANVIARSTLSGAPPGCGGAESKGAAMLDSAPASFDCIRHTTPDSAQFLMPSGPSTALRTGTADENRAEHPFTAFRASSERSGRVVPATQSKGAERSSRMAASFDSVRHTTPDSAQDAAAFSGQDASAGIFRADSHAACAATADENLTPCPLSYEERGNATPPSFAGKGVGGVGAVFRAAASESSPAYTLHFWDAEPTDPPYYLAADDGLLAPLAIEPETPTAWGTAGNRADYIAIVHRSLWDAIQPLLDHRTDEELVVAKVDVQDIYDEFSYGRRDPEAIRSFLGYAYRNWQPPAPQYVLLVGDGHYDFTGVSGTTLLNLIPPYLVNVDAVQGETPADNRFVSVDGPDDYLPEMHVGRIPAQTPADVTAAVSKTIVYETISPAGDWQRRTVFVADNCMDPAGDFHAASEEIRTSLLPTGYLSQTIYYGSLTDCPAATHDTVDGIHDAIMAAFDADAFMVQWLGHASRVRWGSVRSPTSGLSMLRNTDVPNLAANDAWPLTFAYSCVSGYFVNIDGNLQSLGETLVNTAGRGAVADLSPAGFHILPVLEELNRTVMQAIFQDRIGRIGPAVDAARLAFLAGGGQSDLIDTYILFGDPALKLRLPPLPATPTFFPLIETGQLKLTWTHLPENSGYQVWRSARPYFTPGDPDATLLADVPPPGSGTEVAFTDPFGGLGDVVHNYVYVIRGVNPLGVSAVGRWAGDFDFTMTPGE